jgi:hypothetical protein
MTTVFTRLATQEIAGANLLLKADGTDYADLCGVGDTPIGVSTHSCDANYVQTVRALAPGIVSLTASGPISFGDDVACAASGKVAVWSSGLKLGRAVSSADADGASIEVAVALSASAVNPSSGVECLISAAAPTADPGVASGTSAFCIHYDTAFRGFYFWNGTAWEQMV